MGEAVASQSNSLKMHQYSKTVRCSSIKIPWCFGFLACSVFMSRPGPIRPIFDTNLDHALRLDKPKPLQPHRAYNKGVLVERLRLLLS